MKKENLPFELQTIISSSEEHPPIVKMLLSVIKTLQTQLHEQTEQLTQQSQKLEQLLNEIRRLKKLNDRPKIRASTLPKEP